ncbi:MAG: cupin domain-containing protein [Acidobacteria bacterium]|nr:cupin domain-containing protein [Acidobacteriota bacterium]
MSSKPNALPAGEAWPLESLIASIPGGIASRVLAKSGGGSVTLFAFDEGQGLSEHTSPFDALVVVLTGALGVTIGGAPLEAGSGSIVRLPAGVPHDVDAREPTRMLLVMLKETTAA